MASRRDLRPTPDSLIEEMYDWCVRQQAERGTVLADG